MAFVSVLQIPNVDSDQADTYKCFAINPFGKAVCTAALNVIEGRKFINIQSVKITFKNVFKKIKEKQWNEGEIDPRFWEVLLSAPRKDYERICQEFGVTDFRWMLRKLNQKKKEREAEQSKYVEKIHSLKQIEVKMDGTAEFELDMKLKDPNSKILLFKDGEMLDYGDGTDEDTKHNMQKFGETYLFSIRDVGPEDAGLYQVDVEEVNMFSTSLVLPDVELNTTLKDTKVIEGQDAVFECALSDPVPQITWCANDISVEHGEKYDIAVSEDKQVHKLAVKNCTKEDKGVYTAIAGLRSSQGTLDVEDHGVHFLNGLSDTAANVGESAELSCKLSSEDSNGLWYKDGKKLESKDGIKIVKDGAYHKLIINDCQERDAGKYKFEAEGRKSEAALNVKDPPKIDADALSKFSEPVIVKAGENASFKLPFSGKEPIKIQWFKENEELLEGHGVRIEKSSTHSRLLLTKCQRKDTGEIKIKIKNEFATVEATSKLTVLDRPTPPQGPVEIVESSLSAIEFKWRPPKNDGGCPVTNYNLERQQLGRNTWTKIGDIPGQPTYRDTNIDRGRKYCYRIRAKNLEGFSEVLTTNDIAAGTLAFPGSPAPPKIVSAFKDCINLAWLSPSSTGGGSIIGYNVEKRKKGSNFWSQANPKDDPIRDKKYAVKDVIEGVEYEFRVSAINTCGPGEPSGPSECAIARDPKIKPKFTDKKMKSFMVVKAGNTVRVIFVLFYPQASPLPDITWLKNGVPVAKHVTITNFEKGSQLFIYTSEQSDTGIYTVNVKNMVGQDTFTIEIRVTDDPKPPGPVELEQHIQGTVTLSWTPSPDEKRDNHLHYMVMKRDSVKQTWLTLVDCLFNNKFTVINILPGREYYFRVFAKNDIGLSEPSVSPVWGTTKKREKFTYSMPVSKTLDFQAAPKFIVPLKLHAAPPGYECYMSCAVTGNPTPHITWYHNNVSLNTNPNYYITNVCGVCSLLILRVGPKDMGEYKVVAESPLGHDECSTKLIVKGISSILILINIFWLMF
uniref:Immunoglobulin like and fibronectin type III domain containing 1, tandem duplicate 2 n=1 Tax=Sinocyclocheilus grahami TaxID=75366 RepID=A0A672RAL4_SINGR